eukprot:m.13980 g.13980  ORF g.13980 m.13980 type:complete len:626 (+) comp2890_c0_seq2:450-2327(+)
MHLCESELKASGKQLSPESWNTWLEDNRGRILGTNISALERTLPQGVDSLFFFYDEASALLLQEQRTSPQTAAAIGPVGSSQRLGYWRTVRSAWSEAGLPNNKCFAVLMGTSSALLADISPAMSVAPSGLRDSGMKKDHFPPFYCVSTMDVVALKAGPTIHPLLSLFTLGRPLWGSYFTGKERVEDIARHVRFLRDLAVTKLLCLVEWESSTFAAFLGKSGHEAAALSVLSARTTMQVNPSARLVTSVIRNHLGVCLYVSPDRSRFVAGHPSEPIVAEAAAFIQGAPRGLVTCLQVYQTSCLQGDIDLRDVGEFVAESLCLLAADECARKMGPSSDLSLEVLFSRAHRLSDFFTAMFGSSAPGESSCSSNKLNLIPSDCDTYEVCFTHFIHAHFVPSTEAQLKELYERCAAIRCVRNQAGADLIIPVRCVKHGVLRFTCIIIQVKNCVSLRDTKWPDSGSKELLLNYVAPALAECKFVSDNAIGIYLNLGWTGEKSAKMQIERLPKEGPRWGGVFIGLDAVCPHVDLSIMSGLKGILERCDIERMGSLEFVKNLQTLMPLTRTELFHGGDILDQRDATAAAVSQLGQCTVAQLKGAAKLASLKPKSKKQALITQLTSYFETGPVD